MPEIIEIRGDLFKCPAANSLAHCVSQDMHMGKGIAVIFKKKYGSCDELIAQGAKVGDVAVLFRENRYIYYLVTKARYMDKPTYSNLKSSLCKMRDHCLANNVKHLAMPKIGCGLDRLEWTRVCDLIHTVFLDMDIIISIYLL